MWDTMKEIARLNNSGLTSELNDYLNKLDIKSNTPIAEMAITTFDITPENVKSNFELAKKLSALEHKGFRESIRTGLLITFIEDIEKDIEI